MIWIAICDDDRNVTETIQSFMIGKSEEVGEELGISLYQSGEEFLQAVEQGIQFHIVFMDIEMDGINGVEVGQVLRSATDGDDVILIYMSSHDSYFEGIAYTGSFGFVKKPILQERLSEIFGRAATVVLKQIENKKRTFLYNIHTEVHSVAIDEIVFLRNSKRIIEIHTWDSLKKEILFLDKFYSSIDEALEQLPAGHFIQCERSYIINLGYVRKMGNTFLALEDRDSTSVPIGKTFKEQVKEAYFKYRGRRGG